MAFEKERQAVRSFLDEQNPTDAIEGYYAVYYPGEKTQLIVYPEGVQDISGYIAISRTGLDLFRPLVTMRLPEKETNAAAEQLFSTLSQGTPVIIYTSAGYESLLSAFFDIQSADHLQLFVLDPSQFEPIINVHITTAADPNGLPRFEISSPQDRNQVGAVSGLNWQSPTFAELFVNTSPGQRRQGWGRSVLSAAVQHVLESGRTPLYVVSEHNEASINLAKSVGFVAGERRLIFAPAMRRQGF